MPVAQQLQQWHEGGSPVLTSPRIYYLLSIITSQAFRIEQCSMYNGSVTLF